MKKLRLSKEQRDKIFIKNIEHIHSESEIGIYNKYVLKMYKPLVNRDSKRLVIDSLDKERKIITKELPEIVLPKFWLYDEEFIGYGMDYVVGRSLEEVINDNEVDFKTKRDYLVKVGEVLEKMEILRRKVPQLREFYIYDLNLFNVICLASSEIRIIDIDGCSINGWGFGASYYLMQPYYSKMYNLSKYKVDGDSILPNYDSELYCYAMMLLKLLLGKNMHAERIENFEYYVKSLKGKIPEELMETFLNLYTDQLIDNPCRLMKNVTNYKL